MSLFVRHKEIKTIFMFVAENIAIHVHDFKNAHVSLNLGCGMRLTRGRGIIWVIKTNDRDVTGIPR